MEQKQSGIKKWLIRGIIMALVVVLGYWLFARKQTPEINFQTHTLSKETLTKTVTATGKINPNHTVAVGSQVSGTLSEVNADYNDEVKKGEVIARIDPRTLSAAVQESQVTVQKAGVQLNQALRALNRAKQLYQDSLIAEIEMEKAQDDYELAEANFNAARVQLERNEVNLEYATIESPIDGIVISRNVDAGQTIAASFNTPTLFTIANNLEEMKIDASIDEADIGQVKQGKKVTFSVDAYPEETFTGVVEEIQLEPQEVQNVVTYNVEISIKNPDQKLLPGMTANLEVLVDKAENVLAVPNEALDFRPDAAQKVLLKQQDYTLDTLASSASRSVWVRSDLHLKEIPVKVGFATMVKSAIEGKLKAGDEVITRLTIGNKATESNGLFGGNNE